MRSSTIRTALTNAAAGLLLLTAAVSAATPEFTFSSPGVGQICHVGDTIRIAFDMVDTSARLGRDMIGFSRNNGASKTWAFLPLFLNGDDTVSVLKHYDWIIPDSITSSRDTKMTLSTISDSCRVCIGYYETKVSRGASAMFRIVPTASSVIARHTVAVTSKSDGIRLINLAHANQAYGIVFPAATRGFDVFAVDGRIRGRFIGSMAHFDKLEVTE